MMQAFFAEFRIKLRATQKKGTRITGCPFGAVALRLSAAN